MKKLCLLAIFALLLLPTAHYEVNAQNEPISHSVSTQSLSVAGPVLVAAHKLLNRYGSRPLWPLNSFRKGEDVPADLAPEVIAHLIPCESQNRQRDEIDSNDLMSRGILQFQDAFWSDLEHQSGTYGDPDNSENAVEMATYAVEHGYLNRWTCARILKIVKH
jgi:hypothetical protein